MANRNISEYINLWVALELSDNIVIESARSVKELTKKLDKRGINADKIAITFIPDPKASISPYAHN